MVELTIKVTEKDESLLQEICKCLNKARINNCIIHLSHDYVRLTIKIEKEGALLFTVSFPLSDFSEKLAEEIVAIAAFDNNSFYYNFEAEKKSLKISVHSNQEHTETDETISCSSEEEKPANIVNSYRFSIPLEDELPEIVGDLLNLFSLVKIKQGLIVTNNELQLSAVGDRTNLNIKLFVKPHVKGNDLTKFNMLNASISGMFRKYRVIKLDNSLPQALVVTLGATKGIEESFNKTLELMDILTKE